jgi:hypothetical protein
MSLTKLSTDLNNVSALDDEPNDVSGLTAAQVKTVFDKAGNDIKTYINTTLTTEIDGLPASSVSTIAIPTLAGSDVQTVLESVKARIDTIATSNANAEVANTHTGADLRTYTSLSDRLDTVDITDGSKALATDLVVTNAAAALLTTKVNAMDLDTDKISTGSSGTGWKKFPDGVMHQWGTGTTDAAIALSAPWYQGGHNFTFPQSFIDRNYSFNCWQGTSTTSWLSYSLSFGVNSQRVYFIGLNKVSIYPLTIYYYAIGRWK